MSRPAGVFKEDGGARGAWGPAYDDIPKSVFALVAWHMCNLHIDDMDRASGAEHRFQQELEVLRDGGHLPKPQANRAIKAIAKAA